MSAVVEAEEEDLLKSDFLPSGVLGRCAPYHRVPELFDDVFVYGIAEVLD